MRSLTEPNGFCISILARIRTFGFGDRLETSTIGVLPIMSSTLSFTRPGIAEGAVSMVIVGSNVVPEAGIPTIPIRLVNNRTPADPIHPKFRAVSR